jgi:hypothetical protein
VIIEARHRVTGRVLRRLTAARKYTAECRAFDLHLNPRYCNANIYIDGTLIIGWDPPTEHREAAERRPARVEP